MRNEVIDARSVPRGQVAKGHTHHKFGKYWAIDLIFGMRMNG